MNHLMLAHILWKHHLKPGMTVIDATMGNGHDTLFLAKNVVTEKSGWVYAFDIQPTALKNTEDRLSDHLTAAQFKRISLIQASHDSFPEHLSDIDLITYNLGYLPGGDKSITTQAPSTLKSVQNSLKLLSETGLLSIMIYPAHPQGVIESHALLEWLQALSADNWTVFHHQNPLKSTSPSLITIKQKIDVNQGVMV